MASSSFADPIIAPTLPPAPPRRRLVAAVAGAAVGLAAVAAVLALRPPAAGPAKPARFRPADRAFSLAIPRGWRGLRGGELAKVPSAPAAVLRRTDGTGVVVVRERPALASSSRSLTRTLTAQVTRRFRDAQP